MIDPAHPGRSSPFPAIAALVAGVIGIGLLVFGVVRLVGSIDLTSEPATTVGFVTTTTSVPATTTAPATTIPITPSTSSSIEYTTIADETGALEVSVPAAWTDTSGFAWAVEGETVGLSVGAATDRDAWYDGWGTPGVFVGVATVSADVYSPDLGDFSSACTFSEVGDVEYPGWTTIVQVWSDCGGEGSVFTTALVWPSTFEYVALIQLVTLDGSGPEVLERLITTLSYIP